MIVKTNALYTLEFLLIKIPIRQKPILNYKCKDDLFEPDTIILDRPDFRSLKTL